MFYKFNIRGLFIATKTHRDPQWQKSEDIEKKLVGSSIYFANKRPYIASVSGVQAPTIIGTILTDVLQTRPQRNINNAPSFLFHTTIDIIKLEMKYVQLLLHLPLEDLSEVR